MLKELIKLSNYIGKQNNLSYLNNNLNNLIKIASDHPKIRENVLVLNDYLIEQGAKESELLDYHDKLNFLNKLINIFNKYQDNNVSFLCEQIYQQIDDIVILAEPALNHLSDNIVMQIQNDILTAIIPEIINFLNSNPIGNLASSLSKILNLKTFAERREFYLNNENDFPYFFNFDVFNDSDKNLPAFYSIFLNLITTDQIYLDRIRINLELLQNYYGIDTINIVKNNIPSIKDLSL